jgi:hypothetical protein
MATNALLAAGSGQSEIARELYSLEDDTVKLVAYTIVSVRRDHERVMEGGEGTIVVTDSMSGEAFASWMIAKFLQGEDRDPKDNLKKTRSQNLTEDLKYLRVYFVVSTRWPREPKKFEERQIDVLRQIERAMT